MDRIASNDAHCQRYGPIETVDERREGKWQLTVSRTVWRPVKVSPRVIIQRKLPDLLPAGVLYLQVEELVEKVSPIWEELLAELSRQE